MSRGGPGYDLDLTALLWLLDGEGTEGDSREPSEEAFVITQAGIESVLAQGDSSREDEKCLDQADRIC